MVQLRHCRFILNEFTIGGLSLFVAEIEVSGTRDGVSSRGLPLGRALPRLSISLFSQSVDFLFYLERRVGL